MKSTNRALDYGIGVISVAIALGLALLAQHFNFGNVEVPLFLFAVAVTAWYAGPGPTARSGENPAVMLLDLKLPKVDGLEVLSQVKSDPKLKLVPVVVLTSSKEERTW